MSDPIWQKVIELTEGYPAEFNAAAAYDVVKDAWRMGFDVVRAPKGSNLYNDAMQKIAMEMESSANYLGHSAASSR